MAQQGTHVTELVVGMRVRRTYEAHGGEVGTVVKVDAGEAGAPYAVVEYSDGTQWSGTDYAWTLVVESDETEPEPEPAALRATLAENGRAVHVWWAPGASGAPTRQRVAAAARAESGGHPVRYRQTFVEMGRVTAVYSRDIR